MPDNHPPDKTGNSTPSNKWDTVERIAKTISIAAIPLVLAAGGWIIQARLQEQTVRRDYVQLAVTILKEPATTENKEMRVWAADLLESTSPVRFTRGTLQNLREGTVQLPASFNITSTSAPEVSGPAATESASDLELKGFGFLFERNFEAALAAFKKAEKLYPDFHNVAEIRRLLEEKRSELNDPQQPMAWKDVYRSVREKYSWRLSSEIKRKLEDEINKP